MKNRFLPGALLPLLALAAVLVCATAAIAQAGDATPPVVTNVVPADGSTIYTNPGFSVYYQSGNTTPMVIKADYADEAGGSGVDPSSVMIHLDIANMLMNCTPATTTHEECTASTTDLYPGTHPIDVYVSDYAANETVHRSYVTVAVDSSIPAYANLSPAAGTTIFTSQLGSTSANDMSALRFDYDIADAAPSSGVVPMDHVNDSFPPGGTMGPMISGSSCVKTPDATNPTHYSCQVNRAKLLHLGDNTLSVLLKDRVGNSNYSDPTSVNHYTVVDDVAPAISGASADAAVISAAYADPLPTGALSTSLASGINTGSATVTVDGSLVSGCTASATGISCPTPAGLPAGSHTVQIQVADNAGNSASATTTLSIACSGLKPALSPGAPNAFWVSYADYTAGRLSVTWPVSNTGTDNAASVAITSSNSTWSAISTLTPMPATMGDIAGGASASTVIVYQLPAGFSGGFRVINTASAMDACGSSYTYP